MQLIEINEYYGTSIGTYLLDKSLTPEEFEDLENTLVSAQETANPKDIDVVDTAIANWLEKKNIKEVSYKWGRIDMPFKNWE